MTAVELTVKGDIEVLRLQPGDVITVTIDRTLTHDQGASIQEELVAAFPRHSVAIFSAGCRLGILRDEETGALPNLTFQAPEPGADINEWRPHQERP